MKIIDTYYIRLAAAKIFFIALLAMAFIQALVSPAKANEIFSGS